MGDKETIIYADDNELNRRAIGDIYRSLFPDYEFEFIEDGNALDKRLAQGLGGLAAVISDNEMSGMNGADVAIKYSGNVDIPTISPPIFAISLISSFVS